MPVQRIAPGAGRSRGSGLGRNRGTMLASHVPRGIGLRAAMESMLLIDAGARQTGQPRLSPVTLRAPGRLHLGFLDPAGTLGRRFGSLGLVIDGFATQLEISAAAAVAVVGMDAAAEAEVERARAYLECLREHTRCRQTLRLSLLHVLPAHAGFGSGTQLALAIGRAFACWHGLEVDSGTLAHWLGRGRRSGIGIVGFDQGGLLLDGGPGPDGQPAPLLSRMPLPDSWRILVVQDLTRRGLCGDRERQAMAALSPLPRATAAEICHQVLMRVLPGAASGDFAAFAAGVTRMQTLLGEHFAPAQGGSAYTSPAVGQLVQWIGDLSRVQATATDGASHGAAIGQSSWGPTGFAILPSQAAADAVVAAARRAGLVPPGLTLQVVASSNHGATLCRSARSAQR